MRPSSLGSVSNWFSGPPVAAPHGWRDGTVLEQPDHDTVLSWPRGRGPVDARDIVVQGPRTRARYYRDVRSEAGCTKLRFRLGWGPVVLGRPVSDLVDVAVPLNDLMPGLDLAAVLSGTGVAVSWQVRLVHEAARLLGGDQPEPVHRVARRLHVSERHLRSVFTSAVGVSPRRYTQIGRVRSVLAHPEKPLPELAGLTGYYDQSHMTAEFRRLMSAPPAAFRAGRWPEPEHCGG